MSCTELVSMRLSSVLLGAPLSRSAAPVAQKMVLYMKRREFHPPVGSSSERMRRVFNFLAGCEGNFIHLGIRGPVHCLEYFHDLLAVGCGQQVHVVKYNEGRLVWCDMP